MELFTENAPGPLVLWDFLSETPMVSCGAEPYTLTPATDISLINTGLHLKRGQWLRIPRADCPALNISGENAQVSVIAHIKRLPQPPTYDCETIAGVWDESRKMRQYCLFLDLPIWDSKDQVGGHVSSHGGPTPGYKYCMDAAIGATTVQFDTWHTVGFTYDSAYARAYLDGALDTRDGRNRFHYPHGLFDGGENGADFTVGAVSRSGEPGNFFHGTIRALAVYTRALTDTEMRTLAIALKDKTS
ncbi:MAG: LamG-like jellyroll fold domain-containing protein [Chloroflexota bacterium]